jgi:hypothetical protein
VSCTLGVGFGATAKPRSSAAAQLPRPGPAPRPAEQSAAPAAPQKWGSAQAKSYQVIDAAAGTLENVVDLGAGQLRAQATCAPLSDERTDVLIFSAATSLGGLKLPLPIRGTGFVDWLYLSDAVRITRGSKGSLFVHVKEDS